MQFDFPVGFNEIHIVEFYFSKFSGKIHFKVDGVVKAKYFLMFGGLKFNYSVMVGELEQHQVTVEMVRPLFLAPFRSWDYNLYIDGAYINSFRD